MKTDITVLRTRDELVVATGHAPGVEFEVGEHGWPAFARAGAVVFGRVSQRGRIDLTGLGPAVALTGLLQDVLPELPDELSTSASLTLEAPNEPVFDALGLGAAGGWATMACRAADLVPAMAAAADFVALGTADHPQILVFLDTHHTSLWSTPGRMPDERWLGLRDADGDLVAVGCLMRTASGHGRLAGVTVARPARGRGLGAALSHRLTQLGFEYGDTVVLGVDDDGPEVLYQRIGYRIVHRWRSVRLGDPEAPAAEEAPCVAC